MGLQQSMYGVVRRVPGAVPLLRPAWRLAAGCARRSRIWLRTFGRGRHCPCCGWQGRMFLPAGIVPRPDALCPRCGSVERYRLLHLYLRDRTEFFRGGLSVLEIGPAHCFETLCRALPRMRYASVDIESPQAAVHGDIGHLPFVSRTFDVVICYHVLEFIPDDARALREIRRVMRPGGFGVLQVPLRHGPTEEDVAASPAERLRRFGFPGHIRIYGEDYPDRLRQAGFDLSLEQHPAQSDGVQRRRYGLDGAERLHIVRISG